MILKDSKFLEKQNIMDYSLLLIIEKLDKTKQTEFLQNKRNVFYSIDKKYAYHMGVIDYL